LNSINCRRFNGNCKFSNYLYYIIVLWIYLFVIIFIAIIIV